MAVNRTEELLASAARTTSQNNTAGVGDKRNPYNRGVVVHISATAASATPSVVFTIQGKDPVTGVYRTILASAAVTGISDTFLTVYPGAVVSANVSANANLPDTWRVNVVAGDADSLTYSVTASYLI